MTKTKSTVIILGVLATCLASPLSGAEPLEPIPLPPPETMDGIDAVTVSGADVVLYLLGCSVGGAAWSKAEARFRKSGIEDRREDLQDGLLDQAIDHVRHGQSCLLLRKPVAESEFPSDFPAESLVDRARPIFRRRRLHRELPNPALRQATHLDSAIHRHRDRNPIRLDPSTHNRPETPTAQLDDVPGKRSARLPR